MLHKPVSLVESLLLSYCVVINYPSLSVLQSRYPCSPVHIIHSHYVCLAVLRNNNQDAENDAAYLFLSTQPASTADSVTLPQFVRSASV